MGRRTSLQLGLGAAVPIALLAILATLAGETSGDPPASDPSLGVKARPGECVASEFSNGWGGPDAPEQAIDAAYPGHSGLSRRDPHPRVAEFDKYESGRKVAAFRAVQTTGGWFVSQGVTSIPCDQAKTFTRAP